MTPVISPEVQLPGQDYESFHRTALKYALRQGVGTDTAHDIAQTVCMKVLIRGGVPVPEDSTDFRPDGYVTVVARNSIIDTKRRQLDTTNYDEDVLDTVAEPAPSTEEEWMDSIVDPDLRLALNSISPLHRDMLLLSASGYSYKEIAEQVGTALGTVSSGINRARKSMQQALDKQG